MVFIREFGRTHSSKNSDLFYLLSSSSSPLILSSRCCCCNGRPRGSSPLLIEEKGGHIWLGLGLLSVPSSLSLPGSAYEKERSVSQSRGLSSLSWEFSLKNLTCWVPPRGREPTKWDFRQQTTSRSPIPLYSLNGSLIMLIMDPIL